MFIDLFREITRIAKLLQYAQITGFDDLPKCLNACYTYPWKFEPKIASAEIEMKIGNTVVKNLQIVPGLDTYLCKELVDLDFHQAIRSNRLFDQTPELLCNLLGFVYQNRDKEDPEIYFSDQYIPREDVRFLDTNSYQTGFYILLENLIEFINCLNTLRRDFSTLDGEPLTWPKVCFYWPHLFYAYLIENTRIYEIIHRVLDEFRHGERLGRPSSDKTQQWLINTEQLFYKDPPSFLVSTLTSHIRPDLRATRRNAYYRMFGMDLNHGAGDTRPYPYQKPEAANREFNNAFEELLREVWVGMENVKNESGAKATDNGAISDLSTRLQAMLGLRRENGNLSREEFYAVALMSWLHLTLLYDSYIVNDLRANAKTPDQRLHAIAARVGMPAHAKSYHFLQLADCASVVLYTIEAGKCIDHPEWLYDPSASVGGPELVKAMETMITHWSLATGRDMKAKGITGKKS